MFANAARLVHIQQRPDVAEAETNSLQPGLTQMLAQTAGAATDHFVHGPAGVLSQRDSAGGWEWPLADGLGSVRSVAGSTNAVLETRAYDPYGQPLASTGTPQTPFGFTGELADANGLLYLRARHYAPRLGAFPSLDPYEGSAARPMSLNGYAWVEGRVADGRDPSGRMFWAFQTNTRRELLYDPASNENNAFAHAWIERWLEAYNGGFWNVHLEFPGRDLGAGRIDALVLDQISIYGASPIDFPSSSGRSVNGQIFAIEPMEMNKALVGLTEAQQRLSSLQSGTPYRGLQRLLSGTLNYTDDAWNPPRSLDRYANARYDLGQVNWMLGTRLTQHNQEQVQEVVPGFLEPERAGGIRNTWYIILPADGLVLYASKQDISDALKLSLAAVTIAVARHYLWKMVESWPAMPRPRGYAHAGDPTFEVLSSEQNLCIILSNAGCEGSRSVDLSAILEHLPSNFEGPSDGWDMGAAISSFQTGTGQFDLIFGD